MADITLKPDFGGSITSYISSNNEQGGIKAAELMCQATERRGRIAILNERYPPVTSVSDRVTGFRNALRALCPNVHVGIDIEGAGERGKSSAAMEDILQSDSDLKGVFAINDESALGAVNAIATFNENRQKSHLAERKVLIVGYDAMPQARKAIESGAIFGEVVQRPDKIGAETIEAVHRFLTGSKKISPVRVAVDICIRTQLPCQRP